MAKAKSSGIDWIDKIYDELGESDANQDVKDYLSTGYMPLNYALSGRYEDGGFAVGRCTEVFGPESCGKTLLATMAMIETQRRDGLAFMLDYEHAFSLARARQLGLSIDKMKWIYKQPVTAEQGFGWIETTSNIIREANSEKFITVVIDSVASMVTKEEADAGYDGVNMKVKLSLASVMSQSLKKLTAVVNNSNITLLFLNQTRDNPGIMFGDKKITPGGNALKFYASVRVKLTKIGKIKNGDQIIGENVNATIIKNKVTEPFRECEYQGSFKEGINLYGSHIDALIELGKLGDSQGYVEFFGEKMRSKELEKICREQPEQYEKLLSMFREAKPIAV